MRRPSYWLILSSLLLGLQSIGHACATLPEEMLIAYSDAVVDGVATCDRAQGKCRLYARKVIKEDVRRWRSSRSYTLRFDPKARERLSKAMEEAGELWMCASIWEPRNPHIEGRFYLNRARNSYRVRFDSARGDRPVTEVLEDHEYIHFDPILGPLEEAAE